MKENHLYLLFFSSLLFQLHAIKKRFAYCFGSTFSSVAPPPKESAAYSFSCLDPIHILLRTQDVLVQSLIYLCYRHFFICITHIDCKAESRGPHSTFAFCMSHGHCVPFRWPCSTLFCQGGIAFSFSNYLLPDKYFNQVVLNRYPMSSFFALPIVVPLSRCSIYNYIMQLSSHSF